MLMLAEVKLSGPMMWGSLNDLSQAIPQQGQQ